MKLKDFDFRICNGKKYLKQKIHNDNINNNEYIAVTGNVDDENYVFTIEHGCERDYYGGDYDEYCKVKDFTTCNYEIELFTGFYDKKGNKIYENDIVRYNNDEKLVVKFINGTFVACPNYDEFIKNFKYEKDEEDIAKESYFKISYKLYIQTKNNICNKLDVIGNAHENAELLK